VKDTSLLQLALGVAPPWRVADSRFDAAAQRLDIDLDFTPGAKFACPACGAANCPPHDTAPSTWRHLNFFQHQAYLHARVPRVRCMDCGVRKVAVPWARPDSGFTLLFEAVLMELVRAMPVAAAARLVGEHDTRLWRVVHHYVDEAVARIDASTVTRLAIDETAAARGHNYVSLFVDPDLARVLFVAEGKDAATVGAFVKNLKLQGGRPQQIRELCIDMSPAFIKGAADYLPAAQVTFDRFHAMKFVNRAVDQVRRAEQRACHALKGSRYLWLSNPANLSERQRKRLASLPAQAAQTARAYQIKLAFQDLYAQTRPEAAERFLKRWHFWATHSRLQPVIDAAHTIRAHQPGILRWFTSHITNGLLEGLNSLVQAAKAKARGYRTYRNLKAMIYLLAGKLDLRLPA